MKLSKYRNIKTEIDGLKFGSKKEAAHYQRLKLCEKAKAITQLRTQVKYELIPKQKHSDGTAERAVNYIADFTYMDDHGLNVIDIKGGKSTPEFVIKRKLMLKIHGISVKEVR